MELKLYLVVKRLKKRLILIEPLWNWNSPNLHKTYSDWQILIEPLWNWNSWGRHTESSILYSNWTFMELKWGFKPAQEFPVGILIEPLWNWNYLDIGWITVQSKILIEPLWNWNKSDITCALAFADSNWTFMELKSSHISRYCSISQF